MSGASSSNIVVSEDTPLEQEETLKMSRVILRQMQNWCRKDCKENPRPLLIQPPGKDLPVSTKQTATGKHPSEPKRCKMVEQRTKATQTTFEDEQNLVADKPTASYWEALAEKRRLALHEALDENAHLSMELNEKTKELEEMERFVESMQGLIEIVVGMLDDAAEPKATTAVKEVDDSGLALSLVEDDTDD